MSAADAQYVAALVDTARDAFVSQAETELERFYNESAGVLATATPSNLGERLSGPASALLLALAGLWLASLNDLLTLAHDRAKLPPALLYTEADAEALMQPAVYNLVTAALLTLRTGAATRQSVAASWKRQYERGGAFTALRGTIRGATAGTFNTLAGASLIDAAKTEGGWILGAYNPLDERTGELDRALVLNPGLPIVTARGRTVRSIPGKVGKYTLANAWVPGSPRQGGDTHAGCRCVLIPEKDGQA